MQNILIANIEIFQKQLEQISSWNLEQRFCLMIAEWAFGSKFYEYYNDFQEKIKSAEQGLARPMRIAVCGENNSGKSTLINAILGQEIASSDFFEFTFCPMIFCFGETQKALVEYKNGKQEEIKIEHLDTFLRNAHDSGYSHNIIRILVFVSIEKLKNYEIGDVPGIGATERNANVAKAFMDQVDSILFVMNSSLLGQADLVNDVKTLQESFTSVAIILNKIDEIGTENVERATEFVKETLSFSIPVLPMIATDALKWTCEQIGEYNESKEWLNNLEINFFEKIKENSYRIKTDTALKKAHQALSSIVYPLQTAYHKAKRSLLLVARAKNEMLLSEQRILKEVTNKTEEWCRSEAFSDILLRLKPEIPRILKLSKDDANKEIERFFNNDLLKKEEARLVSLLDNLIKKEWNIVISNISSIIREEVSPFQLEQSAYVIETSNATLNKSVSKLTQSLALNSPQTNSFLENIEQQDVTSAAQIGLLAGGAAATLAGILTTFTAAGAIAFVGVPLAVVGSAGTLLHHVAGRFHKKIKLEDIEALVESYRFTLSKNILQAAFPNGIEEAVQQKNEMLRNDCEKRLESGLWKKDASFEEELSSFSDLLQKGASLMHTLQFQIGHSKETVLGETNAVSSKVHFLYNKEKRYNNNEKELFLEEIESIIKLEDFSLDLVDRNFSMHGLEWLKKCPPNLDIRVLLYDIENNDSFRIHFLKRLEQLRRSRSGRVSVRAVKLANTQKTPLERYFLSGTGWIIELNRSLNDANESDFRIQSLGIDLKADFIEKFWAVSIMEDANMHLQFLDL